jgi:hypothetical protein
MANNLYSNINKLIGGIWLNVLDEMFAKFI